jgi:hypothetical protein
VDHNTCIGVSQIVMHLIEQVHPFFEIQPLLTAESAPILFRQVVDLAVINLGELAIGDHELHLTGDEPVKGLTQVVGRLPDLLLVAQQPIDHPVERSTRTEDLLAKWR